MRRVSHFALIATASAVVAFGLVVDAAADCTCRAGGRDYPLGTSVCLPTPVGLRLAVCDMVLNNTSWRVSAAPCVGARLQDRSLEVATNHALPPL